MDICLDSIKRKLLIVFLTLSVFFNAQGQFLYTRQSLSSEGFVEIFPEKNTSNYLISSITTTMLPSSMWAFRSTSKILKINSTGVLIDSLVLDSNLVLNSPVIQNGNFYYLSGLQVKFYNNYTNIAFLPTLLKYDLNFNLIKKQVLDSGYNYIVNLSNMVFHKQKFYIGLMGSQNSQTSLKFFKLDYNLSRLDSSYITGLDIESMESYNNNLLVAGLGFAQGSVYGKAQIAEMDTTFTIVNRFNLDSLTYISNCGQKVGLGGRVLNIKNLGNNRYYIVGQGWLTDGIQCNPIFKSVASIIKNNAVERTYLMGQTGKDVSYTWRTATTSKAHNSVYSVAYMARVNSIYTIPQNQCTHLLIHKVDTAGSLKWTKYWGGDMYYYPACIYATPDSGAIICGYRYDTIAPLIENVAEAFVMKIDKDGNQIFVGIKEKGKFNLNYHKCFPNPVTNEMFFDLPLEENISIEIFDDLSRLKLLVNNYSNLKGIDVSNLPPNLYTYKITTKSRIVSGKFLKQ